MGPGTLAHRHVCPRTRPREGWPERPRDSEWLWDELSPGRQDLLRTRGLMALILELPTPNEQNTFQWLLDPSTHPNSHQELVCYVDGSMIDPDHSLTSRCGFGLALTTVEGELVGLGGGFLPTGFGTQPGRSCGLSAGPSQISPGFAG